MITDNNFIIKFTKSTQHHVLKATGEEKAAADYIPTERKNDFYMSMSGEKELKPLSFLRFHEVKETASQLLDDLIQGYCIMSLFHKDGTFEKKGLTSNFWKGSQVILLDADDSDISMYETLCSMPYKPTFAFTTQSHMMAGKKNRFRFVYVFDSVMHNINDYKKVTDTLKYEVERTVNKCGHKGFKLDSCSKNLVQFFLGNPKPNVQSWASWTIYSPTDIVSSYDDTVQTMEDTGTKGHHKRTTSDKQNHPSPTRFREQTFLHPKVWEKMKHDCLDPKAIPQRIMRKYKKYYKIRSESPLPQLPADQLQIPYVERYLRIYFRRKCITGLNGIKHSFLDPFRNGEKRHINLLRQLILAQEIAHWQLHFDELVYDALAFFSLGYSNKNADGTTCTGQDFYTPNTIRHIAEQAWVANPAYWEKTIKKEIEKCRYQGKVNHAYAEANNMTPRQLVGPLLHALCTKKWSERFVLIEGELALGYTYPKLAKILSERLGMPINPDTLGNKIWEWRKEARKKAEKAKNGAENGANSGPLYNSTNYSSNLTPFTPSPIPPNTPNKKEDILSSNDTLSPLNNIDISTCSNSECRFYSFVRFYDPNKTNAENLRFMESQGLSICERTLQRNLLKLPENMRHH